MIKQSIFEMVWYLGKPFILKRKRILRIFISCCNFNQGLDLSVCRLQNDDPSSLEALHSLLDIIQVFDVLVMPKDLCILCIFHTFIAL